MPLISEWKAGSIPRAEFRQAALAGLADHSKEAWQQERSWYSIREMMVSRGLFPSYCSAPTANLISVEGKKITITKFFMQIVKQTMQQLSPSEQADLPKSAFITLWKGNVESEFGGLFADVNIPPEIYTYILTNTDARYDLTSVQTQKTAKPRDLLTHQDVYEFLLEELIAQGCGEEEHNYKGVHPFLRYIEPELAKQFPLYDATWAFKVLENCLEKCIETGRSLSDDVKANPDPWFSRYHSYPYLESGLRARTAACDKNVDLLDLYRITELNKVAHYAPKESRFIKLAMAKEIVDRIVKNPNNPEFFDKGSSASTTKVFPKIQPSNPFTKAMMCETKTLLSSSCKRYGLLLRETLL